jgi:hypothetical protein
VPEWVSIGADGLVTISGAATLKSTGITALTAEGTVNLNLTANLSADRRLLAAGSLSVGGEAWLTPRAHGADTFVAHGLIHTGSRARLTHAGQTLPPTDELGWTEPDVTPPDIVSLVVQIDGFTVRRGEITDLTIDLDVEGGPKSASLIVNCPLDRAPHIGRDKLLITYKGQTLFRGRLEAIVTEVSSSTGYSMTFAGPLVVLRDHKAFRTVYCTNDLQEWSTDQGPRTSPDTFEVASRSTGATV